MKKTLKIRADELTVKQGLVETRTKAQALIMAGEVLFEKTDHEGKVMWESIAKAGQSFPEDTRLRLKHEGPQDVGRGAQKLRGAFETWPELVSDAQDTLGLDIGSSTGGFTQVLLEKGARRVVALDVGTHQLHERLRADPRVLSLEQTHILKVQDTDWPQWKVDLPFGFVVTDVSFISVTRILGHVAPWMKASAPWIVLVKPQFELDRSRVPKGLVKTEEDRQSAIRRVREACEATGLLTWCGLVESPIQGGDGNIEYLAYIRRKDSNV
jgi:23S rRNA (cytidine1920-2'-O)/16S rRNA (cytidine1409-2'-O)-methyltransferase